MLFAVALKLFSSRTADYDLFGHLKTGEMLLNDFGLLKKEIFSFTASDAYVVNHEWLSQMLLAYLHKLFGATGLIVMKISVGMASAFTLYRIITSKTKNIIVLPLVFLLAVQALSRGFLFRPQIFSYLYLLILAYLFATYDEKGKYFYIVPGIFLFWVNMHGAFVAGLAFLFLFLVSKTVDFYKVSGKGFYKSKEFLTLAAICFLSLMITLLNPYGIKLYSYIAYEMSLGISRQYITEWQPFTFAMREMPFFITLIIYIASLIFSKERVTLKDLLIPMSAAALGLTSVRHTPIFAIMAAGVISDRLGYIADTLRVGNNAQDTYSPAERYTKIFLTLVIVLFLYISTGPGLPDKRAIYLEGDPYPVDTVNFIRVNGLKGKLWLPHNYGMYAIYYLYPDTKVSIDGRWATVYPKELMQDAMDFSFSDDIKKKFRILQKYRPQMLMVEHDNNINDWLLKSNIFRLIYRGKVVNLYTWKNYELPKTLTAPKQEEYYSLK